MTSRKTPPAAVRATEGSNGVAEGSIIIPSTPRGYFQSSCTEWKPLFLQSVWEDAETTLHLSIIVLLPSGVGEEDLQDYKVEDEGRTLVIVVSWPNSCILGG